MLITNDLDQLMQTVDQHGWGLLTIQRPFYEALIAHFANLEKQSAFRPAGVSQFNEASCSQSIRNDFISWLNFDHPAELDLKNFLIDMQSHLKNYFRISLSHFECHFAHYPAGHFYKTHRDQTLDNNRRFFSFVLYLNPQWTPSLGGQLVGYSAQKEDQEIFQITPQAGTLILFQSHIPHEVKPALAPRRSLTGWFRT